MATSRIYEPLVECLNRSGISRWGIADLRGVHPASGMYPRALSLALAYAYPRQAYDEAEFHGTLVQKGRELAAIIERIATFLKAYGVPHELVPQSQQDEATLLSTFPHKTAATHSGMGWIGRNCLLITPEFGPRVRLGTILLDADIPCGVPVTESRCGACRACVDACPYGYIMGAVWHPGVSRATLLSPFECSRKRGEFTFSLGHKHACGLCLLRCPVGVDATVKQEPKTPLPGGG
jgi:epoxyqueuosine reductase QueG